MCAESQTSDLATGCVDPPDHSKKKTQYITCGEDAHDQVFEHQDFRDHDPDCESSALQFACSVLEPDWL